MLFCKEITFVFLMSCRCLCRMLMINAVFELVAEGRCTKGEQNQKFQFKGEQWSEVSRCILMSFSFPLTN